VLRALERIQHLGHEIGLHNNAISGEHWRYAGADGADYARWMLDDLEEAVHRLHELLVAGSA
jgi:hypothetical protein